MENSLLKNEDWNKLLRVRGIASLIIDSLDYIFNYDRIANVQTK